MGLQKFLKINNITLSYFDFYRDCQVMGVPCITIVKFKDVFKINVDHTSMAISADEKKTELSYMYTEYISKIEEVITFQSSIHFSDITLTVEGKEEEIAGKIFDDYLRIFELEI